MVRPRPNQIKFRAFRAQLDPILSDIDFLLVKNDDRPLRSPFHVKERPTRDRPSSHPVLTILGMYPKFMRVKMYTTARTHKHTDNFCNLVI